MESAVFTEPWSFKVELEFDTENNKVLIDDQLIQSFSRSPVKISSDSTTPSIDHPVTIQELLSVLLFLIICSYIQYVWVFDDDTFIMLWSHLQCQFWLRLFLMCFSPNVCLCLFVCTPWLQPKQMCHFPCWSFQRGKLCWLSVVFCWHFLKILYYFVCFKRVIKDYISHRNAMFCYTWPVYCLWIHSVLLLFSRIEFIECKSKHQQPIKIPMTCVVFILHPLNSVKIRERYLSCAPPFWRVH